MNYKHQLKNMMTYKMSDDLRGEIQQVLEDKSINQEDLKTLYLAVKKRKVLLKPRNELDWFPSINYALCTSCKVCFNMCPKNVFRTKGDQVQVTDPYQCVFLCTGCKKKCPQSAITFPDREDYKRFVVYR